MKGGGGVKQWGRRSADSQKLTWTQTGNELIWGRSGRMWPQMTNQIFRTDYLITRLYNESSEFRKETTTSLFWAPVLLHDKVTFSLLWRKRKICKFKKDSKHVVVNGREREMGLWSRKEIQEREREISGKAGSCMNTMKMCNYCTDEKQK